MQITIRLFLLGLFYLLTSCGKDKDPGPDLLPVTEGPITGLLATIGPGPGYSSDTLVYNQVGGTRQLIGFITYEESASETVTLTPLSDGKWSVERVKPITNNSGSYRYFGCDPIGITAGSKPNSSEFFDHYTYRSTLRTSFTTDCEFILTRDEDNPKVFYLESKLYPGNYLTSASRRYDNTSYETWLVYGQSRKAFFILAK